MTAVTGRREGGAIARSSNRVRVRTGQHTSGNSGGSTNAHSIAQSHSQNGPKNPRCALTTSATGLHNFTGPISFAWKNPRDLPSTTSSSSSMRAAANVFFRQLFSCLSRVCLGDLIMFRLKSGSKKVFYAPLIEAAMSWCSAVPPPSSRFTCSVGSSCKARAGTHASK